MQSAGEFCAGNPSPSQGGSTASPGIFPAKPFEYGTVPTPDRLIPDDSMALPATPVQAEPVDVVHDSQVPPTLPSGPSVESLPTIPATASDVAAAHGKVVVPLKTPEQVPTGLNSPSMSPPTPAPVPAPTPVVESQPGRSSADKISGPDAAVPTPTVAESDLGDDSISQVAMEPQGRDPHYWRPSQNILHLKCQSNDATLKNSWVKMFASLATRLYR